MTSSITTRPLLRLLGLLLGGLLIVSACGNGSTSDTTTRDDSGEVQDGGDVGVFRLRPGDCLNAEITDQEESLPVVPCDEPHDSQIYAAFDIEGDSFPGSFAVELSSQDGCLDRFEPTFGEVWELSPYNISYLYPTEDSWDELDDREVLCVAYDDEPLTKSIIP